jgi:adenine specific DNA methylase Mod
LLTEEEKDRIRKEHRALLEKRQHELEQQVTAREQSEHEKETQGEAEEVVRAEEDKFYANKPDYVKVRDHQGNVRWMPKSEFEQKRYRKVKVRKKRTHRGSRRILERISVVLIVLAMIVIAIIAYRAVS